MTRIQSIRERVEGYGKYPPEKNNPHTTEFPVVYGLVSLADVMVSQDIPFLLAYIERLEAVAIQSRILWDKSASHIHDCGGLGCPPYQNSWQELLGANVGINKSLTALDTFIASHEAVTKNETPATKEKEEVKSNDHK